jgi:hypothetical protein
MTLVWLKNEKISEEILKSSKSQKIDFFGIVDRNSLKLPCYAFNFEKWVQVDHFSPISPRVT